MYGRIEEHIAERLLTYPERICCTFEGVDISREQFAQMVLVCRKNLEASGFKEGYRIATVLPNSPLMLALSVAVWQLGGAMVPLSHYAGVDLLLGALKLTDPFAVVMANGLEAVAAQVEALGVPCNLVSIVEPLPQIRGRECHIDDRSLAVIFATSGTTGLPKAVPISHENMLTNILVTCEHINFEIDQPKTALNLLPNFHTFGFCLSGTLPMIMGYRQVVLPSFMPPSRALDALYNQGVTVILAVPTIISMLCEAVARGPKVPPPHLEKVVCGGAPTEDRIREKCKQYLGLPIHEGYGLTECSPIVAAAHTDDDGYPGFVGPIIKGYEYKICDKNGNEAASREGVLWLKGPCVAKEYYRSPKDTAERFKDGWFNTGDVVFVSEGDDRLKVLDRATDIIIVGGFNVYPQEVENCLATHPAVLESAVVGSPSGISGEVVKAFVVLDPEAQNPPTVRELMDYCKDRLAHYKTPRKMEIVKELPHSAVGKVLRRTLKEMERQKAKNS